MLAVMTTNQTVAAEAKPKRPPAKHYRAIATASDIQVDGILTEEIWSRAEVIDLPYEWFPGDNIAAPVKTECLVVYSQRKLYLAFRCFDPEPKNIRAHLMDRDSVDTLISDDHVSVMIDPFNDERRGFQFRVNPLGVQADAIYSELEGYEDFSWDAIWDAAGRITAAGYTLEIAIPFNQLRFSRGDAEKTWGFTVERSYPRNVRHRMTSHVRDRNIACVLCQSNKVRGFADISPGRNLEFGPTITMNRTDYRDIFPDGSLNNGEVKFEPGISARWGITPNMQLNATVNPDFSQVEADAAQLDVNTRFALRFAEKRPFFLEGADFFLTPLEAVFTRTVFDPRWGAKLTGKLGKNAVGFFATKDRYNNLIFPSNQYSLSNSMAQDVLGGVLRYRRDIGKSSTIGVLYAGRSSHDYHNHVVGADAFFRLSNKKNINVQFLHSNTQYSGAVAHRYFQPEGEFGGNAFKIDFMHVSRNVVYGFEYADLGRNFRADFGFIPRVDFKRMRGFVQPILWGKKGGWYDRLSLFVQGERVVDHDGNLTDSNLQFSINYHGPMQSIGFARYEVRKELYAGMEYDLENASAFLEIQPWGGFRFYVYGQTGDWIDYANLRQADTVVMNPGFEWGIGKHLNLNINHIYEHLSLSAGEQIYTANLTQGRVVYNFNVRTFVRAILQYTDIQRNADLYGFPVDPSTRTLFMQFLFSYKINPQTVLFLGYSDNQTGFQGIDLTRKNRTFFLKIGYALVL
jgi:hypothetical protein